MVGFYGESSTKTRLKGENHRILVGENQKNKLPFLADMSFQYVLF